MTTTTSDHTNHDLADARCAAYGLIAHGFRYPDNEWQQAMTQEIRWHSWFDQLSDLHCDAMEPLLSLRAAIGSGNQPAVLGDLQEHFASLFGHTVRGMCPAYELEFGNCEIIQRASELADVSGFYAAFGMNLAGDFSERPDHVSVEAEFLAVLCAKEAWGLQNDAQELVESVRSAQQAFLKAHLGRWLPSFARRVLACKPCDFYTRLSDFADAFVACECRRLGASTGSPYLELRSVDPTDEATQTCGVPGECGDSQGEQLTQLNVVIPAQAGIQ